MKKVLSIAAATAISMFAVTQAFAQAAQQDVNISATVASFCMINGGATGAALSASVPVSSSGNVNTSAINVTGASPPTVVCNTAANLKASSVSGGVKNASSAPPGFTNVIDYTGTASLGATTSSVNTASTAGAAGVEDGSTASTGGVYSGALGITVTPQTPGSPLIPGSYADTLRVTITPQ